MQPRPAQHKQKRKENKDISLLTAWSGRSSCRGSRCYSVPGTIPARSTRWPWLLDCYCRTPVTACCAVRASRYHPTSSKPSSRHNHAAILRGTPRRRKWFAPDLYLRLLDTLKRCPRKVLSCVLLLRLLLVFPIIRSAPLIQA